MFSVLAALKAVHDGTWLIRYPSCGVRPQKYIKKSQQIFSWGFVIWKVNLQCLWSVNKHWVTGPQGHRCHHILKTHL